MKKILPIISGIFMAVSVQAGSYSQDFESATPYSTDLGDGTSMSNTVSGYTQVWVNGWKGLRLTQDQQSGQIGCFALYDLDPGKAITSFSASFDLLIKDTSGSPADGVSFNFGTLGTIPYGGEEGMFTGSGHMLSIGWDTYDNGSDPHSIEVFVDGVSMGNNTTVQPYVASTIDGSNFRTVTIVLDENGLDVTYGGTAVFTDLNVSNFLISEGDRFAFAARTGGSDEDAFIDNVNISTVPEPVSISLVAVVSGAAWFIRRRFAA